MKHKKNEFQKHLRIFEDRSEYFTDENNVEMFQEGVISAEAKKRIKKVRNAFENSFLLRSAIIRNKHAFINSDGIRVRRFRSR